VTEKNYQIISKSTDSTNVNIIDTNVVNGLDEKLRSIAAYYSAKFGTGGELDNTGLTLALKLDSQGSAKHKELVEKYFEPKDIKQLLQQDFFVPPGAANRTNYLTSLKLTKIGDTVKSAYTFDVVNEMELQNHTGKDFFLFDGNKIRRLKSE
jgi:hypothetical protein